MQEKLKDEIDLINGNIDKMYVDMLNQEISKEMYQRVSKKLQKEVKEKEKSYRELNELRNDSDEDESHEIKKVVKEFLKLEKPTPELMRVLINRIEIHQDKQVDILFNFKKLGNIRLTTV